MPQMLEECSVGRTYYFAYRIGSQFTHGGPGVCDAIIGSREGYFYTKDVDYSQWVQLFLIASWSITQPAMTTLFRAGASYEALEQLYAAHNRLRDQAHELRI